MAPLVSRRTCASVAGVALLCLLALAPAAEARSHDLKIEFDSRPLFSIETFGFFQGGTIDFDLTSFQVRGVPCSCALCICVPGLRGHRAWGSVGSRAVPLAHVHPGNDVSTLVDARSAQRLAQVRPAGCHVARSLSQRHWLGTTPSCISVPAVWMKHTDSAASPRWTIPLGWAATHATLGPPPQRSWPGAAGFLATAAPADIRPVALCMCPTRSFTRRTLRTVAGRWR